MHFIKFFYTCACDQLLDIRAYKGMN